jgi:hypothetical protein
MSFISRICACILLSLLFCTGAFTQQFNSRVVSPAATGFQYTTLQVPGSTSTAAEGINNNGDIVGWFVSGGVTAGFLYTAGAFQTISCPNTAVTLAYGINDSGTIVGVCGSAGFTNALGFVYQNGSYSYVQYAKFSLTELFGITNEGLIIGGAANDRHFHMISRAFVYSNGTFYKINTPTFPGGVNNSNTVTGAVCKSSCKGAIFLDVQNAWKKHQTVMYPGAAYSYFHGINDSGDSVGVWGPDSNGQQDAFVYSLSSKTFTGFVVGNSVFSQANGINNSGEIVGEYSDDGTTYRGFYGFLSK